ncbi:hypothetical protein Adt_20660 [Abeliophyllum distichum]|uniref:Uncharacterized protein n=1 Tax=Abeliophyllum distichum TaxID=126358 RepID=A0ABD1SX77_9LAMI
MTSFRKSLENIYETSQDLGLLNVLLAFEDNELDQIISIVKKVDIENEDIVMTAKSVGDESNNSDLIKELEHSDSSSSDEEATIHKRFNPSRGIEFKEPKDEHVAMDYEQTGPSQNPIRDGKRPVGDKTPRQKNFKKLIPTIFFINPRKTKQISKSLTLIVFLTQKR